MAAGEIIPWTDPGGDPCCCAEECFTDFANEPKPVYAEDSYISIASSDYVSLYAGGIYSADVQIDIDSYRQSIVLVTGFPIVNNTERHTASASGIILSKISTTDEPCYERHSSASNALTITREWTTFYGGGSDSYTTAIVFARSLGTQNAQTKLSIASVYSPNEASTVFDVVRLLGRFSQFPISINLRSGNMTDTVPFSYLCGGIGPSYPYYPDLPKVSSSLSLTVSGNTYSATESVSHPCFQNITFYEEVINGRLYDVILNNNFLGQVGSDIQGNFDVQVTFTPSAP